MSRKTRHRRRQRRARAQQPVPANTSDPRPLTEAEWDRLRQRYACMKGRAVTLSFVMIGSVVTASSPEEMCERTGAALVEIARRLPPT